MKCEKHYINLSVEVLGVDMFISDSERLDMLQWGANTQWRAS